MKENHTVSCVMVLSKCLFSARAKYKNARKQFRPWAINPGYLFFLCFFPHSLLVNHVAYPLAELSRPTAVFFFISPGAKLFIANEGGTSLSYKVPSNARTANKSSVPSSSTPA
jgi:hypothetical protein